MAATNAERRWLIASAAGVAIVVLSILTAVIMGELSEVMWLLVVPIGMLGGVVVTIVSVGAWFGARGRRVGAS